VTTRGHHGILLNTGGGGGFTPAALTPYLWYNDDSAVTDIGGGQCSAWNDISGNNYHLDQGNSTQYPLIQLAALNGRRTIRFDGINDSMRNNSTGARAVFRNQGYGWCFSVHNKRGTDGSATARAVFTSTNGTTGDTRFVALCGNNANIPAMFARRLDGDSTAVFNDTTTRAGVWVMQLWIVDWTNGDAFLYTNGTLQASTTSLTSNGSTSNTDAVRAVVVGGYPAASGAAPSIVNGADIDLAELIVGRSVLSSGDISNLFDYAAARWGL
jgi:hypothetical protein